MQYFEVFNFDVPYVVSQRLGVWKYEHNVVANDTKSTPKRHSKRQLQLMKIIYNNNV